VSNFGIEELSVLLASAKIKPAANQVTFCPYWDEGVEEKPSFAGSADLVG
jgi:diketogulonate reductase-like aldo/keto reductase